MIHIVTAENRRHYHHALMEMHRQRKQVFIDQMKWRLEESAGIEIDAYDCPEAVYLIEAAAPRAPVTGSARLLRTDRPHLLGDHFPYLCDGPVPSGADVWEATRFCPAPDAPNGQARHDLLARMIAAIMETALLFGVERVCFVANGALAPLAQRAGWDAEPLGRPRRAGRDRLTAFVAAIDQRGLRRVRELNDIKTPVTRFFGGELNAAA
ncbi:MAG: autoinducer synthase [Proteobacteria bacterium]|nr:autoinducer synthase [Pseudomonadota bacterium]